MCISALPCWGCSVCIIESTVAGLHVCLRFFMSVSVCQSCNVLKESISYRDTWGYQQWPCWGCTCWWWSACGPGSRSPPAPAGCLGFPPVEMFWNLHFQKLRSGNIIIFKAAGYLHTKLLGIVYIKYRRLFLSNFWSCSFLKSFKRKHYVLKLKVEKSWSWRLINNCHLYYESSYVRYWRLL